MVIESLVRRRILKFQCLEKYTELVSCATFRNVSCGSFEEMKILKMTPKFLRSDQLWWGVNYVSSSQLQLLGNPMNEWCPRVLSSIGLPSCWRLRPMAAFIVNLSHICSSFFPAAFYFFPISLSFPNNSFQDMPIVVELWFCHFFPPVMFQA